MKNYQNAQSFPFSWETPPSKTVFGGEDTLGYLQRRDAFWTFKRMRRVRLRRRGSSGTTHNFFFIHTP
jgi:hypothetical protein